MFHSVRLESIRFRAGHIVDDSERVEDFFYNTTFECTLANVSEAQVE